MPDALPVGASPDDLGLSYMAARGTAAAGDAEARLAAMAAPPVDPAADMGAGAPGVPAGGADEPARSGGLSRWFGAVGAAVPQKLPKPGDGAAGAVLDAAGTVVRHAGEIPGQIVGGALDGLRETFRAADDIANWLTGQQAPAGAPRPAGWAGNPGEALAQAIPSYPAPDTATGKITHDVAQFLTGFLGAGRVIRGVAGAATTTAGKAAQAAGAGAIADFFAAPANRARLADLWNEAGLPPNALADYLASDPADDAAEGRLKNAVEGLGIGIAAEGLIAAARGFRGWSRAGGQASPAQAEAALAAEREAQESFARKAIDPLGDADAAAPLTSRAPIVPGGASRAGGAAGDAATEKLARAEAATGDMGVPDAVAARGAANAAQPAETGTNTAAQRAATEPGHLFVNFARVQAPEDVQAVMRDMADAFRADVNEVARGVQGNEATAALARDLNLDVPTLLARRQGEPWNAETALAARQLWTQSAEKLTELAKAAAAPGASEADQFAFRRMMATHYAIQAEVLAARRETARALQSWSIPAGTGAEQARAIQQMLEQNGGAATSQAMAKRLVLLAQNGADAAAIAGFARAGWAARSLAAVHEVWINALLSSPKTHLVNIGSNAFVAAQQVMERRVAEAIGDSVAPGEAATMAYGLVTGLRDAFRLAGKTWRDGDGELGALLGKVDLPRERAVSSAAMGVDAGSGLGLTLDFVGHSVVALPTRALGAEDAFFKSLSYRMELHAGALRMARDGVMAEGVHAPGSAAFIREVGERQARLLAEPPEALRLQAGDQALYATFNRPTYRDGVNVSAGLQDLRRMIPPIGFILPFIRTPANVVSYSFERTPLAPLVGQWRADIAAGGARRDLALARLGTGSAIMALAFDLADRGMITGRGPDKPGQRENLVNQGAEQYSIRVGDKWVSYNRMDPLGFTMGFAADFADLLHKREIAPEDVDEVSELLANGVATVARSVVQKTWMQGFAGFIEALDQPDRNLGSFLNQFTGSFVPAVVAQTGQAVKPEGSDVNNPLEAVMARIPLLADSLPPRRNLWGETRGADTAGRAIFDAFSPVRVADVKDSPIDAEMARLGVNVARIGKKVDFSGAPVNLGSAFPGAYDQYVRLAGNEWKHPAYGTGLKDTLNDMVQGRGPLAEAYRMQSEGRDGGKALMIRHLVQEFRAGARAALLAMPEYAGLAETVQERRQDKSIKLGPMR